jgi:G protein beta subunit-like protein
MSVLLATGGYDSSVRLWDASSNVCYKSFVHPEKQVNCLAISPDKAGILAGGNPLIRLYDANSAGSEAKQTFEGHTSNVKSVGMDSNARFLFSGSEDGSIKIWDPRAGGAAVRDFDARGAVNSVILHPNQGELISGSHMGALRTWDIGANKCTHELMPEGDTPISSVAITPDAGLVAASNFNGSSFFWTSGDAEYAPVKKLRAHKGYITSCCFSPDGRLFATTSSDKTLKLWNTQDFSLSATLAGHTRWVWDASFSADSSFVVTASSDMTAKLWDLCVGEVVRTFTGHSKSVVAVALNDSAGLAAPPE